MKVSMNKHYSIGGDTSLKVL